MEEAKSVTYYKRKAAGVCTRCGKPDERTVKGRVLCAECAERRKKWEADHRYDNYYHKKIPYTYIARKAAGVCTNCGASDERTQRGLVHCAKCAELDLMRNKRYGEENREYIGVRAKERYWARKDAGKCVGCGKEDELTREGRAYCAVCIERIRKMKAEAEAKE